MYTTGSCCALFQKEIAAPSPLSVSPQISYPHARHARCLCDDCRSPWSAVITHLPQNAINVASRAGAPLRTVATSASRKRWSDAVAALNTSPADDDDDADGRASERRVARRVLAGFASGRSSGGGRPEPGGRAISAAPTPADSTSSGAAASPFAWMWGGSRREAPAATTSGGSGGASPSESPSGSAPISGADAAPRAASRGPSALDSAGGGGDDGGGVRVAGLARQLLSHRTRRRGGGAPDEPRSPALTASGSGHGPADHGTPVVSLGSGVASVVMRPIPEAATQEVTGSHALGAAVAGGPDLDTLSGRVESGEDMRASQRPW